MQSGENSRILCRNFSGMLTRFSTTIRRFSRTAYLDNQATTPMDPRVLDAMLPYLTGRFGNPHSRSHAYGWEAEEVVEKARTNVADLIGADTVKAIQATAVKQAQNFEPQKPRAEKSTALPKQKFSSFEEANAWIEKRMK